MPADGNLWAMGVSVRMKELVLVFLEKFFDFCSWQDLAFCDGLEARNYGVRSPVGPRPKIGILKKSQEIQEKFPENLRKLPEFPKIADI